MIMKIKFKNNFERKTSFEKSLYKLVRSHEKERDYGFLFKIDDSYGSNFGCTIQSHEAKGFFEICNISVGDPCQSRVDYIVRTVWAFPKYINMDLSVLTKSEKEYIKSRCTFEAKSFGIFENEKKMSLESFDINEKPCQWMSNDIRHEDADYIRGFFEEHFEGIRDKVVDRHMRKVKSIFENDFENPVIRKYGGFGSGN